ncbi:MAG: ABC transporter substrate-binding protein [Desulfovibrionaceae bacterium]
MLLALALVACANDDGGGSPADSSPGVTDGEVVFGSSLALSGHAAYLGTQALRGAMCYINEVNASGGVAGRTIRIIAYDDAYDPPQCLRNTQRLIVDDQVFGLFCYVGTPTTVKITPFLDKVRIPLLGIVTGANALRVPFNRYIINVRASYYQETEAAVEHLVKDLGLSRIAVFYQYDAYGFDGLTGTELALKNLGLETVARGSYVRGTLNVADALDRIERSGAQAVVMIATSEPCAEFIHMAEGRGYTPLFYTVSFVGADELARRLGRTNERIIMSQVVPPPVGDEASRALLGEAVQYPELLRKYFPNEPPSFVGLEGYLNARVLVEGLRRAGRDLTREGFIDALESMPELHLGPGLSVAFSPQDHQGMNQVYFTWLRDGRFVLLDDWPALRRVVRPDEPDAVPDAAPRAAPADHTGSQAGPQADPLDGPQAGSATP